LTLFTKEPDDCQNTFERIIYVLKNMDILERMPWMAQDAVFKRLASIAEIAAMSEKQRLEYDESLRKYRDTLSVMEGQYQEGIAQGILKTARNLKQMGMPVSDIIKATGLSPDEIEKL